MNDAPPPQQPEATEVSFPVEYQRFSGNRYNEDLKGTGTLTVLGQGAYFRFTGRHRSLASFGVHELRFAAADISNVETEGDRVEFTAALGRAGKLNKPFIFFCRDAGDAAAVAALLPKRVDEDHTASREFAAKLRQLSGPESPALSVTNILIGVNVAVFLVMAGLLGAGWVDVTDLTPYIKYGASNGAATTDGEWWRLITCMFLHYGVIHLALNMWALFQIGRLVERLLGRSLFALTYFASGIGGGLLSLVWHGDKVWSAGASGAIFGLYGALLGYMLRERQALPRPVLRPLLKSTLLFAGYNLLYGLVHPGIDNAAHVGGLVSGIGFGWICAMPLDPLSRARGTGERFALATLALVVMFGAGFAIAPRFPYVVRDELAWQAVVKDVAAKEAPLLVRFRSELQRWGDRGDNAESLEALLRQQMVPLYADFGERIRALTLAPNRITDRRRAILLEVISLKEQGFGFLERSVQDRDQGEFQEYLDANRKVEQLIKSLADLKG
jgi:rhomboid protease GluP